MQEAKREGGNGLFRRRQTETQRRLPLQPGPACKSRRPRRSVSGLSAGQRRLRGRPWTDERGIFQVAGAGSVCGVSCGQKRAPILSGVLRQWGRSGFKPLTACIVTRKLERRSFVCFPIPGKVKLLCGLL